MENKKILIVEDEVEIADILKLHLQDLGCEVVAVHDGNNGMEEASREGWNLIILDIQLPGPSGLDICRSIRRQQQHIPVIMLTSRSTELDRVIGLDLGADDYITKPFSILEMLSRIKALFRRIDNLAIAAAEQKISQTNQDNKGMIKIGELCIDERSRCVWLAGNSIELTGKEFDLLLHFAQHPDRVFRRAELLDSVWGYGHEGYEHTVNSHINRLRAKIEPAEDNIRYIATVWGIGYKMLPNTAEVSEA